MRRRIITTAAWLTVVVLLSACASATETADQAPPPVSGPTTPTSAPLPTTAVTASDLPVRKALSGFPSTGLPPAQVTPVGPVPVPPPAGRYQVRTDPARCPRTWFALDIYTTVPEEAPYLEDLSICTSANGQRTSIENDGDGVWVPQVWRRTYPVAGTSWYRSTEAQWRANSYSAGFPFDVLTPDEKTAFPVPPSDVSFVLNFAYSTSWHAHDLLLNELKDASGAAFVAGLNKRTPRGAALAQCTYTVYEVVESREELFSEKLSERALAALGGTSNGATCLQKWQQADEAARRSGQVSEARVPTAATLKWRVAAAGINKVDTFAGRFASGAKIAFNFANAVR